MELQIKNKDIETEVAQRELIGQTSSTWLHKLVSGGDQGGRGCHN